MPVHNTWLWDFWGKQTWGKRKHCENGTTSKSRKGLYWSFTPYITATVCLRSKHLIVFSLVKGTAHFWANIYGQDHLHLVDQIRKIDSDTQFKHIWRSLLTYCNTVWLCMCTLFVVAASKFLKWVLIKLNSHYLHSYRTQAFQEAFCGFGNVPGVVPLRSEVWLQKKPNQKTQSIMLNRYV